MTDGGQAFRDACASARKTAERLGLKMCHVRWKDGALQWTGRPINGPPEPTGWRDEQGELL